MKSIGFAALAMIAPAASAAPDATAALAAQPLVSAFNDTCRRGFPDIETVRRHAAAQGWVERKARPIAEASDPRLKDMPQPYFLQKAEMMLILSGPNAFTRSHSCSVSLSAGKALDTAALAALVSEALAAGPPTRERVKGVDRAQWRPAPAFLVDASVSRKPVRSATILVRTEP